MIKSITYISSELNFPHLGIPDEREFTGEIHVLTDTKKLQASDFSEKDFKPFVFEWSVLFSKQYYVHRNRRTKKGYLHTFIPNPCSSIAFEIQHNLSV